MRIVGINMQGSNVGTGQSKYVGVIQQFFRNKVVQADIVCAQEAGPQPPVGGSFTAIPVANYPPWLAGVAPLAGTVYLGSWLLDGTSPMVIKVFWLQTDPGANRNNLCILIKDDIPVSNLIRVLPAVGPLFAGSRGAIGFQITSGGVTRQVYTVHGLSGMGATNDAHALTTAIAATAALAVPAGGVAPTWAIVGDFNRHPTTQWPVPPPGVICPPDRATLPSHGSLLDYAIRSAGPAVLGVVQRGGSVSDHQYVIYDI
jgi:hypothetical protein